MPITASCSACNSAFRVGDEYAGKRVKCPKCGEAMTVPGVGESQGLAAGPPSGPAADYAASRREPRAPNPAGHAHDDLPPAEQAGPRRHRHDEDYEDDRIPDEPRGPRKLGSLAQAARGKQLKTLRILLFIVGGMYVVVSAVTFAMLREEARKLVQEEVRKQGPFFVPDPVQVRQVEDQIVRLSTLLLIGQIVLGIVYIIFGFIVYLYPLPIAIVSLVLFLGTNIAFIILDPANLYRGIILKIIFLVALIKGIQAAIAHQQENARFRRGRDDEDEAYEPA